MTNTMTPPHPRLNSSGKASGPDWGRIFESKLFWILTVIVLFALPLGLSFRRPRPERKPVLGTMGAFSLLNQDGRAFSNRDVAGSVLLVNFVFTSCGSSCPLLTKTMSRVQDRLRATAKSIQLLSVTVDPEHDTPKVLKDYALKYNADFTTWTFLTGSKQDIHRFVVDHFASPLSLEKSDDPADMSTGFQIAHGEHFVLVDQLGRIRAYEHIDTDDDINRVLRDIAILVNTPT